MWCARINLSCWRPGVQWRWIYEWVARADKLCMGLAGVPRGGAWILTPLGDWTLPMGRARSLQLWCCLPAARLVVQRPRPAAPCTAAAATATSLATARSPRHTAARAPLHGYAAHRPPAPEFSLFSSSHVHCKEDLASNPDWFQIFNQTLPRHRIIPDIFRLKRKIPFEEAASTIQPQWGFLPAFQPLLPDLPCGLDRNRPKTALVRLKFSASVQCAGESWALELAGERRLLRQDFVWTDLRNNPWVLLAEVSTIQTTTTLVLYQSI